MAAGPPVAQKLTKRAMHAGRDDIDAGLEVEAQAFGHLIATDDVMEGMTRSWATANLTSRESKRLSPEQIRPIFLLETSRGPLLT